MRVKVIELDERSFERDEEEHKYIGQTFEALVFYNRYEENEDYKTMYALGLENGVYFIPACCCEVIDDDVITTADNKVIKKENILLVEDGSVDIDQLEEYGFYVIVYRQGATPPMWLK
jgi:hypothetical protein